MRSQRMEGTNSSKKAPEWRGWGKYTGEEMSVTNSNESSPVLSPAFSSSSHLDKEQRVWAVDLQAMITEKSKLGSREPNRKILARDLCLYSSSPWPRCTLAPFRVWKSKGRC